MSSTAVTCTLLPKRNYGNHNKSRFYLHLYETYFSCKIPHAEKLSFDTKISESFQKFEVQKC